MRNREIEELKKDIKVLNDSVTELQQNLLQVASACGLHMTWHSYHNEGRYRITYGPLTPEPLTIKEQMKMLMEHLGVEVHREPAIPEKLVLRKAPKK